MSSRKNELRWWLRQKEKKKYNTEYFQNECWKEDLPGITGNRGLSYDDPNHWKRFTFLADLLQKHFEFNSFVDAGCGLGLLVDIMAVRGVRAYGFDFASAAFGRASNRIKSRVVVGGIETIPFSNSCVDLVFCSDVLEHVPVFDLELAIFELIRVTKLYIVATINLDNPYKYHPTILSRKSWEALFLLTEVVCQDTAKEKTIQRECIKNHPEYDFLVFEKLSSV